MSSGLSDTRPEVLKMLIAGYRAMTPQRKMDIVRGLNQATQQMALARLRQQYPDATERELALRLASLTLTRDLMIRAFGWDPEEHGR